MIKIEIVKGSKDVLANFPFQEEQHIESYDDVDIFVTGVLNYAQELFLDMNQDVIMYSDNSEKSDEEYCGMCHDHGVESGCCHCGKESYS